MTSCVTYTWSRSFLTKEPVVRPSSIPTPSAVGRMPGRGAVSWSWRRAISGMGISRNSGPLILESTMNAPGSPRRLSVVTSDDEPTPRRIACAVWTHLGTGLDKAVIVLTSDRAAPSRCAARTPLGGQAHVISEGALRNFLPFCVPDDQRDIHVPGNNGQPLLDRAHRVWYGQTALALITELTEPVGITPSNLKPVPSSRCLNCSSVRSAPPATISMFRSRRPPGPVMPSSTISTT